MSSPSTADLPSSNSNSKETWNKLAAPRGADSVAAGQSRQLLYAIEPYRACGGRIEKLAR